MAGEKSSLQDAFLNTLRKTRIPVTVFLVSGVKLTGHISAFEKYCLLLKRDHLSQLVYKHAISTIVPSEPIFLHPPSSENETTE